VDRQRVLLVGDNPFHGISHLSQERAISRGQDLSNPNCAGELVGIALGNGAEGFMFTVSETTLSILRTIGKNITRDNCQLHAIVPYTYEFVRLAVAAGGIPGLGRKLGRQIILSRNYKSILFGLKGLLQTDPHSLLKAYLSYEVSRIKSAADRKCTLSCLYLHELITDMSLVLDLDWLIEEHIDFMIKSGIKPGFHTHNLPYLVRKFHEWGIDFKELAITTQFNVLGFQMCPSKEACEEALAKIPEAEVVVYGILASGYLRLPDAIEYVKGLPNIDGLAVGVSKKSHASETFRLIRDVFRE
jgi:hypothetical protein